MVTRLSPPEKMLSWLFDVELVPGLNNAFSLCVDFTSEASVNPGQRACDF